MMHRILLAIATFVLVGCVKDTAYASRKGETNQGSVSQSVFRVLLEERGGEVFVKRESPLGTISHGYRFRHISGTWYCLAGGLNDLSLVVFTNTRAIRYCDIDSGNVLSEVAFSDDMIRFGGASIGLVLLLDNNTLIVVGKTGERKTIDEGVDNLVMVDGDSWIFRKAATGEYKYYCAGGISPLRGISGDVIAATRTKRELIVSVISYGIVVLDVSGHEPVVCAEILDETRNASSFAVLGNRLYARKFDSNRSYLLVWDIDGRRVVCDRESVDNYRNCNIAYGKADRVYLTNGQSLNTDGVMDSVLPPITSNILAWREFCE